MEEIKAPKKERKFLKAMGDIALTLFRELLLGVGKKVINKVGNKRQGLAIAFVMVAGVSYATIDSIPYPITGNKQKLGWQTSGNGLVYRGSVADTVTKPSNYTNKDIKAYLLVDTVNNVMYSYIASKGGWQFNNSDTVIVNNNFAQPVDSLFFDTSVPSNNVDTAKMRWDSELATVVLGMYDKVPNELGFKNFWLVKNQTGSTITKGSIVYANGTVGASGRITVAKFIANGSIDAKYLLGITAHDLTDGEDGYVISFGKIRQVNTDTFAAGAILYPSPTVAGVWTDIEPIAPNIDMPIGFCINSSSNNGTIAIRVASGYKLHELHDLAISSPVDKASLYYKSSEGLWSDTTAALLVSDTALMLTNYLRTGVAASTYQTILANPITGIGTTNYLPIFTGISTLGNSVMQQLSNNIGINTTPFASLTLGQGKNIMLDASSNNIPRILFYETNARNENDVQFGAKIQYNSPSDRLEFVMRDSFSADPSGDELAISIVRQTGNTTIHKDLTVTGNITEGGNNVLTNLDTASLSNRIDAKQNTLVSGTNIKTVNSNSLLGSGNISVGTVTSVGGTGTVNGITLTGTVTSSGNLTLGGTLSGVSLSSQVSGTLPIANGGTNAATISQARTNLQVPNIATTITPQAPLTGGGSLAGDRTISIPVATSIANGYLSSTDWSTFNGKQNAITLTTTGTSGAATLTGATLNIPQYSGGASGTVTSVTVTSPLSVINSTTTPQISISAASGTSSAGVVTTTTQQFGGAKTFNDNLTTNGNMEVDGTMNVDLKATFGAAIKATSLERNVVNTTGTSITLGIATTWLNIHQTSNFTVTLPSAATYPGKEIHIRNSAGGVVLSASSNIIDMAVSHAGSTTTIIMAGGTAGQFTTLVSDGTNWIQTQLDNN